MSPKIRPATPDDVPAVLQIIDDASAWLRTRGLVQWPERFPPAVILEAAERRELHVAVVGGQVVATVTLQWSDPTFWGGRADAGFVHRLAVDRGHAGLGRRLLDWADGEVARAGRTYVCLDVVAANHRLRAYYETAGFELVREIERPATHPHTEVHGLWRAALYQRSVPAPDSPQP